MSLLPVGVKILVKVLVRQLETIMTSTLSEDQMGFIRQRHSVANIRRLLALIHTRPSPSDPAEIVSLDAEKAFDRVEWATVRHATALWLLKQFHIMDSVALYLASSSCIHEHLMF